VFEDGDVVIANRQPSLHRQSLLGFRVVVERGRTRRFCGSVCSPFNADFDGDEMNIFLPRAE
jgi:DNA-directed RNA polymerase beta' subunit